MKLSTLKCFCMHLPWIRIVQFCSSKWPKIFCAAAVHAFCERKFSIKCVFFLPPPPPFIRFSMLLVACGCHDGSGGSGDTWTILCLEFLTWTSTCQSSIVDTTRDTTAQHSKPKWFITNIFDVRWFGTNDMMANGGGRRRRTSVRKRVNKSPCVLQASDWL